MNAASQLKELAKGRCFPFRISRLESAQTDSWILPAPWTVSPPADGYWDFCAFRFPQSSLFFKLETNMVCHFDDADDRFPHAWMLEERIYSEQDGYLRLSQHSILPECRHKPEFGFELMDSIPDPDASAPDWDGYGQWVRHKFGGAPWALFPSNIESEIMNLTRSGYINLIQIAFPGDNIDPALSDDYEDDWLFGNRRLVFLFNPESGSYRYIWCA